MWRKSSFCNGGSCVEVAPLADGGVAVRDGKDPDGPVLAFPAEEWRTFIARVRAGEFDTARLADAGDGSGVDSAPRASGVPLAGFGAGSE